MLNVLINAYAVSPSWGSEPGMGWNWVINLAEYCNVHVITEGEWAAEIEDAVAQLPQRDNIHFYFLPVSDAVRKICWNQGDWRFYWYYRKWQKRAYEKAREIISQNRIDVIHQLNMIGFREPGYLWKIKDVPFVWGPVGGMGDIPVAYLKGAGWKQDVFCRLKNVISNMQIRFSHRVRAAARRGVMIAATKEVKDKVKKYYGMDIRLINETGCYPSVSKDPKVCSKDNVFRILWVGKFDFRKQFELALKTVALMNHKLTSRLHVVSPFSSVEQQIYIENQIHKYGLTDVVELYGRIPNAEVHRLMKDADVFLFTSIMEGTPHVVLEAVQNKLPIVCLNTCGQGEVVDSTIGAKVNLSDADTNARELATILDNLYENRSVLSDMSRNCVLKQQQCSWRNKADMLIKIYKSFL